MDVEQSLGVVDTGKLHVLLDGQREQQALRIAALEEVAPVTELVTRYAWKSD